VGAPLRSLSLALRFLQMPVWTHAAVSECNVTELGRLDGESPRDRIAGMKKRGLKKAAARLVKKVVARLYVYRWNRMERKGQICRVVARGTMNSCLVEFADGHRAVTSRNALKRLG
jgi:hypothetical protein